MSINETISIVREDDPRIVVAVTATSASTEIPDGLFARWVKIKVDSGGSAVHLNWGDSSVVADDTATSGDNRTDPYWPEQESQLKIGSKRSAGVTHVAYKCAAGGSATLRILPASDQEAGS